MMQEQQHSILTLQCHKSFTHACLLRVVATVGGLYTQDRQCTFGPSGVVSVVTVWVMVLVAVMLLVVVVKGLFA